MARHTNLILGYGIYFSAGGKVREKSGRKFSVLLLEVGYFFRPFLEPIIRRFLQIAKNDY